MDSRQVKILSLKILHPSKNISEKYLIHFMGLPIVFILNHYLLSKKLTFQPFINLFIVVGQFKMTVIQL